MIMPFTFNSFISEGQCRSGDSGLCPIFFHKILPAIAHDVNGNLPKLIPLEIRPSKFYWVHA